MYLDRTEVWYNFGTNLRSWPLLFSNRITLSNQCLVWPPLVLIQSPLNAPLNVLSSVYTNCISLFLAASLNCAPLNAYSSVFTEGTVLIGVVAVLNYVTFVEKGVLYMPNTEGTVLRNLHGLKVLHYVHSAVTVPL